MEQGNQREQPRNVRKEEMSKCEEYSTFKFSVPHQENARTGFGVLLLKRRCRQALSRNASAGVREPSAAEPLLRCFCAPFLSPAKRNANIGRSLIVSVLAEGPRTDL